MPKTLITSRDLDVVTQLPGNRRKRLGSITADDAKKAAAAGGDPYWFTLARVLPDYENFEAAARSGALNVAVVADDNLPEGA
ncbi:hypothetical protein LLS1_18780 [Leifsonia sp. LS1]|uniref:hypothetical protein n=1 Tax=Leifsonia sp. LS1 TaxID=2828483 RepID=UPI001CFEE9A0|nr:hypothetical protein [Leifsonia sp. LS1]GIT80209.1 hypothetical protein LLS1_18780 [Leifsonia sp. LS1]